MSLKSKTSIEIEFQLSSVSCAQESRFKDLSWKSFQGLRHRPWPWSRPRLSDLYPGTDREDRVEDLNLRSGQVQSGNVGVVSKKIQLIESESWTGSKMGNKNRLIKWRDLIISSDKLELELETFFWTHLISVKPKNRGSSLVNQIFNWNVDEIALNWNKVVYSLLTCAH